MSTPETKLGEIVDVSKPCTAPERIVIHGKYCDLVPWNAQHTKEVWPLLDGPENLPVWEYWPAGPYENFEAFEDEVKPFYETANPLFWSIIEPKSKKCQGHAILGEMDVENRNIESGMFLTLPLQKTRAATEAFYLIANYAFQLNFRRLAWKTNTVNVPSRRAAERYGMTCEGIWRQHQINKGRNRDSVWYAMVDKEWPVRKAAFEKWLQLENFDAGGKQKTSLVAIRKQLEADGAS